MVSSALARRARRGAGRFLVALESLVFGTALTACPSGPYQTTAVPDPTTDGTTAEPPGTSTGSSGATDDTSTGADTTGADVSSSSGAGASTGDTSTGAPPACGDGVVDPGEECDDGNQADDDACLNTCVAAMCGDGVLMHSEAEECDDGNLVEDDGCTVDCKIQICGDGKLQGAEGCDDGNTDDSDACPSTCQPATCGDTFTHDGVEQCDAGDDSPFCDGDCTLPECGDQHINLSAGEQCDDGGEVTVDCDADCTFPTCGDGFLNDNVEECDDGNQADGDGCAATCTKERRVVFVSSQLYTGNLGGLPGADAKCQQLAVQAGLTGTFRAWLSDGQNSPSSRFVKSSVPYVLPDGKQIAKSWTDLTDGILLAPINLTEKKTAPPPDAATCNTKPTVWTNTREDGTAWNGNICGNFTNTFGDGRLGTSTAINFTWTRHCTGAAGTCAWKAPIYCFEQ